MKQSMLVGRWLRATAVLAVVLPLGACQPPAEKSPKGPAAQEKTAVEPAAVPDAKPQAKPEVARQAGPGLSPPAEPEAKPQAKQPAAEERPAPNEAIEKPEDPTAKPAVPDDQTVSAAKGAEKPKEKPKAEDDDEDAFDLKELEENRKKIQEEMAKEEIRQAKEQERRIAQLGSPLVDNVDKLVRLHKVYPIWTDPQGKRVVIVGEIAQRQAPLEMFACPRHTKEHEAVVVVDAPAQLAHAGLLAVGAKAGKPVQFMPKYVPANGQEIEVSVVWKDAQGKVQTARAQDWVRNVGTRKALEYPWVFAGSAFAKDEFTGKVYYQADGGDFICVSNFATAMLDLPVESSSINQELTFEAFTERIPERGTPVTLILAPKPPQKPAGGETAAPREPEATSGRRVQVSGSVEVDGQPLESGSISFISLATTQGPSAGAEIKQGKYLIAVDGGPDPGKYRVEIKGMRKTGRQINDGGNMIDEIEQFLPPKYSGAESELAAELKPGRNVKDFQLLSK